jgi:hypothetical protein
MQMRIAGRDAVHLGEVEREPVRGEVGENQRRRERGHVRHKWNEESAVPLGRLHLRHSLHECEGVALPQGVEDVLVVADLPLYVEIELVVVEAEAGDVL